MSQQNYDLMITSYLTQPVQPVSAAHAVDEMFDEYYDKAPVISRLTAMGNMNVGVWVPLNIVCASVYEPHRAILEIHKMLNFMKINDARSYFWAELQKRKLHVAEVQRGETWGTSRVRFSTDPQSRARFGGVRDTDIGAPAELRELMEEALRVLSSIAKIENAKAIGQL